MSIAQLKTELTSLKDTDIALVFDLFGNFSYRFIQADGSLALPILMGGRYHLLGDMAIVQDSMFKGLIPKIIELLGIHKSCPQVILPPIPRYICGSCCDDINHGNNCRDPARTAELGAKIGSLRKILKEGLVKSTLDRIWVPDIMGGLLGNSKIEEGGLDGLFTRDNIHLSQLGAEKMGKLILDGIERANSKNTIAAVSSLAGAERFFWRGFASQRGASRAKAEFARAWRGRGGPQHGRSTHGDQRGRGWQGRDRRGGSGRGFHPYQR